MQLISARLCSVLLLGLTAAAGSARAGEAAVARYGRDGTTRPAPLEPRERRLALLIFSDRLQDGWLDGGGSARDLEAGAAARIDFGNNGSWVVASRRPVPAFASLRFDMVAPSGFTKSLTVRLGNDTGSAFPTVQIRPRHITTTASGWITVRVNTSELNPGRLPVTSIRLAAVRTIASTWVQINRLAIEGVEGDADGFLLSTLGELPASGPAVVAESPATEVSALVPRRNRKTRGVGVGAQAGVMLSPSSPTPGYLFGFDVHVQPTVDIDYILAVAIEGSLVYRSLHGAEPASATSVGPLEVAVIEVPLIAKVAGGLQLAGGVVTTADFGIGTTMVRGTTENLGVLRSDSTWALVLRAGLGIGLELGPGLASLEAAYLHVQEVNFEGMLEGYAPGGLALGLRYAFDR